VDIIYKRIILLKNWLRNYKIINEFTGVFTNTEGMCNLKHNLHVYKHEASDLDCTIVAETLTDYDKACD